MMNSNISLCMTSSLSHPAYTPVRQYQLIYINLDLFRSGSEFITMKITTDHLLHEWIYIHILRITSKFFPPSVTLTSQLLSFSPQYTPSTVRYLCSSCFFNLAGIWIILHLTSQRGQWWTLQMYVKC